MRNMFRQVITILIVFQFALAEGATMDAPIIPAPPTIAASGYLLMDAETGTILVEQNSKLRLPPASLTKIMTSYIAAGELKSGSISLDDEVLISVKAWKMEGSRMFIQEGSMVSVEDLIRGVVIQSGNDASVALAEYISGSEDAFADVMNQQALRLGMTDSSYMNSTGLPDENHYTTARDLAILSAALINQYPEHYKIYSEKSYTWNNIPQRNRNSLLFNDKTVDGVKTGFTDAAGYCLVSSAYRDGMRLVAVVMGANSVSSRASESQKLLTYGFRYYDTERIYQRDESLKQVRVWGGKSNVIDVGLEDDIVMTLQLGGRQELKATTVINEEEIFAPLQQGQELGLLTITREGDSESEEIIQSYPLVALNDVESAGYFQVILDSTSLFFLKLFQGDPLALEH